jgi:hypothetical protein
MNGMVKYAEQYSEHEKSRYRDFLVVLSDSIRFEDDTWVCEKRLRGAHERLHNVSLYFSKVPEKYKTMVKYYAIIRLIQGVGVRAVGTSILNVGKFLNFLGDGRLDSVNVLTASRFKEYLDSKGWAESTRAGIWNDAGNFLRQMNGFDGLSLKNPFGIHIYKHGKQHDYKYIPDHVAKQLDSVFMGDDIEPHLRCVYWLLRLIPSRISEILGMKIDCVKPFDGRFCIFIPTWKQNGGYREPIMRTIHVNDEGMGGHLLGLIWEQQENALRHQELTPKEKKNALFTYESQCGRFAKAPYRVATWEHISYHFKKICAEHRINDEDGNPYNVTTHQFRHNGITDRLRAGFSPAQIAEMTGHHGTAMILASYAHLNLFPETLIEPNLYTTEKGSDDNPYVLFGGKILNMDAINEARLLSNIRAHRVPGGICADITHCKSGMWHCLDCRYFIPEKEQLPYFEKQILAWKDKAERFKNDAVLHTNFTGIAGRFGRIIEKVKRKGGQEHE